MRNGARVGVLGVLGVLAAVLVAGCGGSDSADESGSAASGESVVEISGVEYAYATATSSVAAGEVTFELTNDGTMGHDLVLDEPSGSTDVIEPGETDSFTVTLEPGVYTLYCSVGNHRALGMEIEITVE